MLMSLRYTGMVTQPKLLTCSGVNHGPYVILSQFVATFIFFLNPAYTRIVRYWSMASSGACFFWIQALSLEVKRLQLQHWLSKIWAFLNARTFSGPVNSKFQQCMGVAVSIKNQGSEKCIKNQDIEIWKVIHKCPYSTVLAIVQGSVGYVYSHPIKTTSIKNIRHWKT